MPVAIPSRTDDYPSDSHQNIVDQSRPADIRGGQHDEIIAVPVRPFQVPGAPYRNVVRIETGIAQFCVGTLFQLCEIPVPF